VAVSAARDHLGMISDTDERLEPGMLLKCWRCGNWHPLHFDRDDAGNTEGAKDMLFWQCRGGRFYAGQAGYPSRHPDRRPQ
jgi:hypothetical protein